MVCFLKALATRRSSNELMIPSQQIKFPERSFLQSSHPHELFRVEVSTLRAPPSAASLSPTSWAWSHSLSPIWIGFSQPDG